MRVLRRADRAFALVHLDLAAVGLIEADQALHERAFAGAVFAEERMERTRRHLDRDIVQGGEGAKTLAHAAHLDFEPARRNCAAVRLEPHQLRFDRHQRAPIVLMSLRESETAPNTPPCIFTILSAAR